MAQQLGPAIERATSPFQYALSTRPEQSALPNLSAFDGIGAFDVVSRQAMFEGFLTVEGSDSSMPFVLQFYGSASSYLWKMKEESCTRSCKQMEEDKVTLLCRLSSLLVSIQHSRPCRPSCKMENVFSLSWMTCTSCAHLHGSTRFMGSCSMSSSPIRPFEFTTGRLKCGTGEVWLHWALRCCRQWPESTTQMRLCGEAIPLCAGRIKACGFWAHHWDTQTLFVPSCLRCLRHMTSCTIQDLQCAWLLLLYCCGARANCTLRVVHPELTAGFAVHHDASLRRCFSHLLGVAPASIFWDQASLPLCLGGLGLRSATLLARPAFWASWADCLEMIHQRHPTVCARIVDALHAQHPSFHLDGVRASGENPASAGFHAPSWQELAAVARPEQLQDVDMEPGIPRHGWQRTATEPVHGVLIEGTVRPILSATEKALFRSQGGPLAGIPFMFSHVPSV